MRSLGVFGFEAKEIGPDLDLVPLAARRALDHARLHLSLEGWRSLAAQARRALVLQGARDVVEAEVVAGLVAGSAVAARPMEPPPDLDPSMLPEDVGAILAEGAARARAAWRGLHPLERFALVQVARKSVKRAEPERLAAAVAEILGGRVARGDGRVREVPLSVEEAVHAVSHDGAGGVDLFLGVVRDTNDGRAVTLLEYEAYRSMAEAELGRIETEIEGSIPGVRVFASHRIGSLRVGDVAVVCAASAPHRGEAFRACRLLIDEIKARLPIWKREHGPDGPYWVGWEDARCGGGESGEVGHGHGHGG